MKKALSVFLSLVLLLSVTAGVQLSGSAEADYNVYYLGISLSDDGSIDPDYTYIDDAVPENVGGYVYMINDEDGPYNGVNIVKSAIYSANDIYDKGYDNARPITDKYFKAGSYMIMVEFSTDEGFVFDENLEVEDMGNYMEEFPSAVNPNHRVFGRYFSIYNYSDNGIIYSMYNENNQACASVVGYEEYIIGKDVSIPSQLKLKNSSPVVKQINNSSMSGAPINSVTIPKTVTNIGYYAFNNCDSLKKVTFAKGSKIKSIGTHAFGVRRDSKFNEMPVKDFKVYRYRADKGVVTAVSNMVAITKNNDTLKNFTVKIELVDPIDLTKATVTGIKDAVYNGASQKQYITVKVGSTTLKKNVDYKVTYKNNVQIGTATMILTGIGDCKGTLKKYFKILPKRPAISVVKPGKGSLKVKWKKQSGISGYVIQESTSNKFTKKATVTRTVEKTAKSLSVNKLQRGTRYYTRIRSYKVVNGKRYYSAWSKVVKAKTE